MFLDLEHGPYVDVCAVCLPKIVRPVTGRRGHLSISRRPEYRVVRYGPAVECHAGIWLAGKLETGILTDIKDFRRVSGGKRHAIPVDPGISFHMGRSLFQVISVYRDLPAPDGVDRGILGDSVKAICGISRIAAGPAVEFPPVPLRRFRHLCRVAVFEGLFPEHRTVDAVNKRHRMGIELPQGVQGCFRIRKLHFNRIPINRSVFVCAHRPAQEDIVLPCWFRIADREHRGTGVVGDRLIHR